MEIQKTGPFLILWFKWWLQTNSFSIPIVVPSDGCKKTFKIFINQATKYTCELDFYHSLADGETKTQKGSMPNQRAQRGAVPELQTKQLEPRHIWCCILLLLLLLPYLHLRSSFQVSDHNPTVTQESSIIIPLLQSLSFFFSVTQLCVTLLTAIDSHVLLDISEPAFLSWLHRQSSGLKFHHISISAILYLWSQQRQSHKINISPENIAWEIVSVSPLLCHLFTGFHLFCYKHKPCFHLCSLLLPIPALSLSLDIKRSNPTKALTKVAGW